MKKNTDHIVLNTVKPQFECRHCGAIQVIAYPIYLSLMIDMMKSWTKMHRHCKKREPNIEDEKK